MTMTGIIDDLRCYFKGHENWREWSRGPQYYRTGELEPVIERGIQVTERCTRCGRFRTRRIHKP